MMMMELLRRIGTYCLSALVPWGSRELPTRAACDSLVILRCIPAMHVNVPTQGNEATNVGKRPLYGSTRPLAGRWQVEFDNFGLGREDCVIS